MVAKHQRSSTAGRRTDAGSARCPSSMLRGPGVDELIKRIDTAARAYPYGAEYRAWPGPNSNFAWIARAVPELEVDLPATAIGKDYLGSAIVGAAPSGSGVRLSLGGE